MFCPVNGGVCYTESEDNIFLTVAHDIEEVFLSNSIYVGVEGTGVANHTSFVHSLAYVSDCDGGGKFFCGEFVFPKKLPVNVVDISTRFY